MSATPQPFRIKLPWSPDRRESTVLWGSIALVYLLSLPFFFLIPSIELPEPTRAEMERKPPILARLEVEKKVVEKKKITPPPEPEKKKPEEKKPEKKPKPEEKPKPKPEPKPKPKPKPQIKKEQTVEEAQKVARQSGMLALADELSDMRDMVDTQVLNSDRELSLKAETIGPKGFKVDKSLLSKSSGGVKAGQLAIQADQVVLEGKQVAKLEERKPEKRAIQRQQSQSVQSARSSEEVRRVFDRNKSALNRIYQRALRKNPALAGKVILRFTIEPSGAVSKVELVSSELGDQVLEQKIMARVKLFNFGAKKNVKASVFEFPIDFLPP